MNSRIKESFSDRIFNVMNCCILTLFFILLIFPLIYVISASFSSSNAVVTGRVWLFPVEPTIAGYVAVFKHKLLVLGFRNSFLYMIVGTIINIAVTILAAYPMSQRQLPGNKFFMIFFSLTIWFSGGMIPTYLVIKNLGMINSFWVMVLPGALSVYNMIVMRSSFENNIPKEVFEAAQIDGCDHFKFLIKIVLPLSGSIIAVIGLFYAVGHWNAFFNALIYIRSERLFPLQLVLRDILVVNQIDNSMLDLKQIMEKQALSELLKYSAIVVASVPMLILYPFVQRFFVKGLMAGAVKG